MSISTCEINHFDVLIVGAGPAGLTAGHLLSCTHKVQTCILERNTDYVGGISRTEKYKGYHFDIGGHRFFTKSDEVQKFWDNILPDEFLTRQRKSRIFYQKKFLHYPLQAVDAVLKLGFLDSLLSVLSYIWARLSPTIPEKSFHDWVRNKFGERLFQKFFKSYTEKVWGISCDELSSDWAAQRIKGLDLRKLITTTILRSIGLDRKKEKIKTLIESFRYPRLGPGMFWETTANQILENGGQIKMGIIIKSAHWDQNSKIWTVHLENSSHIYTAKHLISSAALRDFIPLLTPQLSVSAAVQNLKYRDFITAAVILKTPPKFDDNWIYIHDPHVHVGRIQNFSAWSPDMIPPEGKGCLGLEYFCNEGDSFSAQNDIEILSIAKKELITLGLVDPNDILDGTIVRQPKAYPVYDEHYKDILDKLKQEVQKKLPNFHMVGRNGLHKYNNQDHAIMTAMLTVKNIIADNNLYDVWSVNIDAEYHEEQKIPS